MNKKTVTLILHVDVLGLLTLAQNEDIRIAIQAYLQARRVSPIQMMGLAVATIEGWSIKVDDRTGEDPS